MIPPSWSSQYPHPSMPGPAATLPSSPPGIETLEIEYWFQVLEDDKAHNQCGLNFTDHGRVLKQNSFQCVTQLSHNIISIKDLQEWLNIDAGAAAFIMEYAQEEHQAILRGRGSP